MDEMKTDFKKDMTPMNEILNNAAHPNGTSQKNRFSISKNKAVNVPVPNIAERKTIMENSRR